MATRQREWIKKNVKRIYIDLYPGTDIDIIETLAAQPNRQGFIKAAIRRMIQDSQTDEKKPD